MQSSLVTLLDLEGQVAIVTGGAMSIVRGIAETLCGAGAWVVIADCIRNGAESVATRLRKLGRVATKLIANNGGEYAKHPIDKTNSYRVARPCA